jgi:hypothetical protein
LVPFQGLKNIKMKKICGAKKFFQSWLRGALFANFSFNMGIYRDLKIQGCRNCSLMAIRSPVSCVIVVKWSQDMLRKVLVTLFDHLRNFLVFWRRKLEFFSSESLFFLFSLFYLNINNFFSFLVTG